MVRGITLGTCPPSVRGRVQSLSQMSDIGRWGGVGWCGGRGGQNPSCRGVYFSLLFPQENFVPPVVNVLPFPKFKASQMEVFYYPLKS